MAGLVPAMEFARHASASHMQRGGSRFEWPAGEIEEAIALCLGAFDSMKKNPLTAKKY
jgi:hypothetical protein